MNLGEGGAKQLVSASAAQVKAKSADLIDSQPSGSFRDYIGTVKTGGELPEIIHAWNRKQEELKKKGLANKEMANIAADRRKNRDLEELKLVGGPFTSASQVEEYTRDPDIDDKSKLSRMYREVRYARDTCLSLPRTSDIFRLLKDHKKLPVEQYAKNLMIYLDNASCKTEVSMDDFNRAMDKLTI